VSTVCVDVGGALDARIAGPGRGHPLAPLVDHRIAA